MEVLYWVSESKPFHFLDVGINSPYDLPCLSNNFRSENLIRNQEEVDKDDITFFSRLPPYFHASHFDLLALALHLIQLTCKMY